MPVHVVAQTIDQLSREKGIDPEIVIAALEDAMVVAARKHYKTTEDMRAEFDRTTGALRVFALRKVVEEVTDPLVETPREQARRLDPKAEVGGEVHLAKPTDELGRIAAQTVKQVILQKVREALLFFLMIRRPPRSTLFLNCVIKRQ